MILNLDQWKRCCVKISIFSSGDHFVWQNRSVRAILVQGLMRNMSEIILKFGQGFRRYSLKIFLFLALVAILIYGANHLGNFGRGP